MVFTHKTYGGLEALKKPMTQHLIKDCQQTPRNLRVGEKLFAKALDDPGNTELREALPLGEKLSCQTREGEMAKWARLVED
jgi:hypothetical protein